jgi:hypothetical protein
MNTLKKLALLGTCLPTFAFAQTPPQWKHDFNLGLEVQHYHYKEPEMQYIRRYGWEWMEQKAYMGGLSGSYRLTWQDRLFAQTEARILLGKENYKTGDGDKFRSGLKYQIPDLIFEPRLLVGGNVAVVHNQLTFSPYTGLGYRLKIDDGEEVKCPRGTTLAYRKSNYVYIPLGASLGYKLSDTWSISAKGEYDYFIKGWQYSRGWKTSSAKFKQNSGYGLKGEVSVSYAYSNNLSFSVSPYIHYWNIKKSKDAEKYDYNNGFSYVTYEPKNSTVESGVRFGVSF